ncbi:MAG: hypothetical protein ACOVQ7_15220 [Limnoraphis robusta]
MFDVSLDQAAIAAALLNHYSFDLGDYSSEQMIDRWAENYEYYWIYLAVIEALYQGRYKSISVAQILSIWQRRGKPIYHFNLEFEQLISHNLPETAILRQREATLELSVESEDSQLENTDNSSQMQQLKPIEPLIKPKFYSTKPPVTSASIHTDFMLKLKRILENSQKILPPASSPPSS